jgi:prophage maintenance system killer protein
MRPGTGTTSGRHRPLSTIDLAGVVYSAGKVFDGLSTGRIDTAEFLRRGTTAGIFSRPDLQLLEDLRDMANLTVARTEPVDAEFVKRLNGAIARSGPLHPGRLRTQDQGRGVRTTYGDHEPPALTDHALQSVVESTTASEDPAQNAIDLFVALAKAQPFEDGNKRSALFAANAVLIPSGADLLLTVPVDDHDPSVAAGFIDLLARAYVLGEETGVKTMLRERGLTPIERQGDEGRVLTERFRQFPELRSVTLDGPGSPGSQPGPEDDGDPQLG